MAKSAVKKIVRFSSLMKVLTIISLISILLAYLAPLIHPGTFWLLPFFGLSYPILFFLSLVLLIYWAIVKSKWALVILGVLILGFNYHTRLIAIGAETEPIPDAKTTLKIISNNVRIFDLYESDPKTKFATRDSIFAYVNRSNAEVACFQEFYEKDQPTNFSTDDLFNKLFKSVDHHDRYAYKPNGRQRFGIIMFSKYPMIAKGDIIFETDDDKNFNFCIYADIVKNMDTFRVYNVHLQSVKIGEIEGDSEYSSLAKRLIDKLRVAYPKRADQALRITEHISKCPYPVIVCGDFNDTPVSYVYNQFNSNLTDAFLNCGSGIGTTYVGKIPAGRIDYIFHSPELFSTNFVVQKHPISDHRAIECVISKK